MRNRSDDWLLFRLAFIFLERVGIDHASRLVPDELADVETVRQHAAASSIAAADQRLIVPCDVASLSAMARTWNAILGQLACDHTRRAAGDVFLEDATNNLRLLGIDLGLTWLAFDNAIAIRNTAGDLSLFGIRAVMAMNVDAELSQILLAKPRHHQDMHRRDLAVDGQHIDGIKVEPLPKTVQVLLVAGQAREALADQYVEFAGEHALAQLANAVTVERRA